MQDERLGPATIGILAVVLSNKPDWVVYPEEIAKRMGVSRQFVYDGPYFDGAIKVDMTFYIPAPKSMSEPPKPRSKAKKVQQYDDFINERIYVDKKPDLDNLEKAVYDSISKAEVVWTDDNIIVEHTTRKVYSPRPRIEIEVEEVK